MSYKVGQVILAVLRKEAVVFPIQVVEEITKKTLDGEATTYMVRAGADPTKTISITEIDGEIFDTAEAAKATLIDRVSASVSQRVDQAVAKAKEWYPSGFETRGNDPLSMIKRSNESNKQHAPTNLMVSPELAALANEFRRESDEGTMVELEDGVMAKVRSVKLPDVLQG